MAKVDPHEMMTAALILRGKEVDVSQLNLDVRQNATKLVEDLSTISNKIGGGTGDAGFFSTVGDSKVPSYVNLAKAIPIANYVLKDIPKSATIKKVYQTGGSWHADIPKHFNPDTDVIKNYNSSDIVIRLHTTGKNEAEHWWGISLKKRAIKEPSPTLLNKPVVGKVGFLTGRFSPADVTNINDQKDKFFRQVLNIVTGGEWKGKDGKGKGEQIKDMDLKAVLKACDEIFHGKRTYKNNMLTGRGEFKDNPNIYFEAMHKAFEDYVKPPRATPFFEEYFDLIFKINLDTYINDASFHFSLITGAGDFSPSQQQIQVGEVEEFEGRTTSEIFRTMFKDPDQTSFRLVKQEGAKKLHAWEPGATAAKLFYEMVIGKPGKGISIVDLEVRFKGHLTTEPQFQVFVNKVRENGFAKEYARRVKESKMKKTRWD